MPVSNLSYKNGRSVLFFFIKQKTAYEIGLGIPAEPLFRSVLVIPLTLSNLKLLRRITRTENILHRNFTRRQVAIQNRSEERRVGKECSLTRTRDELLKILANKHDTQY